MDLAVGDIAASDSFSPTVSGRLRLAVDWYL